MAPTNGLTFGAKLGPYEIQAPVGAVAMREAYLARSPRVERTVAVKILPSHRSDHPETR